MSLRENETKDLRKLMEWHLQQANKNKDQYEFHVWAATLLSLVKEVR